MKTLILTLALVVTTLSLTVICFAGQKYNPYKRVWETTPIDSEMKYDVYNKDWSYQDKDAKSEYNPYENKWEWDK